MLSVALVLTGCSRLSAERLPLSRQSETDMGTVLAKTGVYSFLTKTCLAILAKGTMPAVKFII